MSSCPACTSTPPWWHRCACQLDDAIESARTGTDACRADKNKAIGPGGDNFYLRIASGIDACRADKNKAIGPGGDNFYLRIASGTGACRADKNKAIGPGGDNFYLRIAALF